MGIFLLCISIGLIFYAFFSLISPSKHRKTEKLKYHPDKVSNLGDEVVRQATETMKQINMAWDVIKMSRGIN